MYDVPVNNNLLKQAEKWLGELGIRTKIISPAILGVNRDDMVSLMPGTWEEQYAEILKEMSGALGTKKLFFGGKDDEWIYLESF